MKAWETFNSNNPKRVIQQNDHHSHPKNEVKTQIKYNGGMLTILSGFFSLMHSSISQRKGNPSQLILMTTKTGFLRDTDIVLSLLFLLQKTLAQSLIVLSLLLVINVAWLLSQGSLTLIQDITQEIQPHWRHVGKTLLLSQWELQSEYFPTHTMTYYLSIRGRTITTVSNTSRYLCFNLNSLQREWTRGWMGKYGWWPKNETAKKWSKYLLGIPAILVKEKIFNGTIKDRQKTSFAETKFHDVLE